jgi:hypothetical protein
MSIQKVRVLSCSTSNTDHVGKTGLIETNMPVDSYGYMVRLDGRDWSDPVVTDRYLCRATAIETVPT